MKHWPFLITLLLICLVGVGLLLLFDYYYGDQPPKHDYAETKTETLIRHIVYSVRVFEIEYGRLPFPNPGTGRVDNTLLVRVLANDTNSMIALELNPKGIFLLSDYFARSNPELRDGWDNPLHIVVATNQSEIRVDEQIIPSPVNVWSSGRNGKDELGKGDDIVSWKLTLPSRSHPRN